MVPKSNQFHLYCPKSRSHCLSGLYKSVQRTTPSVLRHSILRPSPGLKNLCSSSAKSFATVAVEFYCFTAPSTGFKEHAWCGWNWRIKKPSELVLRWPIMNYELNYYSLINKSAFRFSTQKNQSEKKVWRLVRTDLCVKCHWCVLFTYLSLCVSECCAVLQVMWRRCAGTRSRGCCSPAAQTTPSSCGTSEGAKAPPSNCRDTSKPHRRPLWTYLLFSCWTTQRSCHCLCCADRLLLLLYSVWKVHSSLWGNVKVSSRL